MTTLFAVVFLIIFGAESLVGITTNAFVVAVNLLSWAKGNVLIASDQVLLTLGLANLGVQGTSAVAGFSFFYQQLIYKGFASQVFWFFFVFSNSISLWLTVLLFSNYSLMMTRTLHPIFFRMKRIIIKNMPWILCYNFLVAFGMGLLVSYCSVSHDVAANLTSNSSEPFLHFCNSLSFRLIIVIIEFIWPLVVTSFRIARILTDIWKHIWNIKKTMAGPGEPSLKAHRDATTILTVLLVLQLFYTITYTIMVFNDFSNSNIWFLVCATMFSILTSAQGVTFILGIPKFKEEAWRILQNFRLFTSVEYGKSPDAISYVTPP